MFFKASDLRSWGAAQVSSRDFAQRAGAASSGFRR